MTKKYILKPGKHQFAPGSAAIHSNDNLNDEEAKWYLERYPHIASLFCGQPLKEGGNGKKENMRIKKNQKIRGVGSLTPPSGGEGNL